MNVKVIGKQWKYIYYYSTQY